MSLSHYYISVIRLLRSRNVGSLTFKKAIQYFGSVEKAIHAIEDNPLVLGKEITLYPTERAEQEYHSGTKQGGFCISYDDPLFPQLLSKIYDCPPLLWAKGYKKIFQNNCCAIVGARNASIGGRKIAYSLAKNLGINKFITVSGLATGIDTSAHQGAVEFGTIAVMASGINHIYPAENKNLVEEIIAHQGLILSEAPPDTPPQANMFIRRNRIISGLSLGVVIIEAGLKSGSLSTAEFALEHNREIFAVPGSPLDSRSTGTNNLLRNGANWAENSDDVLQILHGITQKQTIEHIQLKQIQENSKQIFLTSMPKPIEVHSIFPEPRQEKNHPITQLKSTDHTTPETIILKLLSTTPIPCDELIRLSEIPSSKLLAILSELEIMGDISRHPGNMFSKVIKKLAL